MRSKTILEVKAELRDPDGMLIKAYPWKRVNSLLKQYVQMHACFFAQANQTITDTGGVNRNCSVQGDNMKLNALAAGTTFGLLVGTGTNPVTMTDVALQAQVVTNVSHSAVVFAVENPDVSTWRNTITRVFTNNTGALLSIRELALYAYAQTLTWYFCLDRALYSVDVPAGVAVTLTFRITQTL